MAHVILRAEIADDDECVHDYGISQMAESLVEDAGNSYTGWTISVVEVEGPDDPTQCYACGCTPHGDEPCASCSHPFCQPVVPSSVA